MSAGYTGLIVGFVVCSLIKKKKKKEISLRFIETLPMKAIVFTELHTPLSPA